MQMADFSSLWCWYKAVSVISRTDFSASSVPFCFLLFLTINTQTAILDFGKWNKCHSNASRCLAEEWECGATVAAIRAGPSCTTQPRTPMPRQPCILQRKYNLKSDLFDVCQTFDAVFVKLLRKAICSLLGFIV